MEVIKQEVYDSEFGGIEIKSKSLESIAFWIDYELKLTGCGTGTNFDSSSTVRNTDSTYSASVNCRQTLVIPDITITKLDDTTITYPAAKNIDIGDIDSCTAPTTFDQLVTLVGRGYNYPQSTGQTTSYRTGDDAWVETNIFAPVRAANDAKAKNSLLNFTTLNHNNAFGNTNRFTDDAGGQTYANDYYIDHYTGLGYYSLNVGNQTWDNAIDAALASTVVGFTDWFILSVNQAMDILHWGNVAGLNPFGVYLLNGWTSTTNAATTTSAVYINTATYEIRNSTKTGTRNTWIGRKHY